MAGRVDGLVGKDPSARYVLRAASQGHDARAAGLLMTGLDELRDAHLRDAPDRREDADRGDQVRPDPAGGELDGGRDDEGDGHGGQGAADDQPGGDAEGEGKGGVANRNYAALAELICDDQPLIRAGLRALLGMQPDIEVVGEAADGAAAVSSAAVLCPDVVLMDVRMPGTEGIAATAMIVRGDRTPRVLVLTTYDRDEYVFDALAGGASGFLLKDARPEDLVAGIRTVAARGRGAGPADRARARGARPDHARPVERRDRREPAYLR